ncbi:MAG TPA: 30S ribosomal protein S6 [Candidatus Moranbacteria bacterium]|nr:30S ribosomal protein S6 [Candidatus Moranbacteria bacterium]
MRYEIFYLIGASREAEAEKIIEEIKKIVTSSGGVFEEKETREKRKLAYKIKHETHGLYVAQRFSLEDPEAIKDISKKTNLNQDILRFIISKADEIPELKSKEERIAEATQKSVPSPEAKPEKKEEKKQIEKEAEVSQKKEKEISKEDDIDKKLEEILNI